MNMILPIIGLTGAAIAVFLSKKKTATAADNLLDYARKFLGVPYLWGGTTPDGFDCSGFTSYVYKAKGISLPRTADAQYNAVATVPANQIQAGDLVFFKDNANSPVKHVGILLNDQQFIHASSSQGVTITPLNNSYWQPRIYAFGRV